VDYTEAVIEAVNAEEDRRMEVRRREEQEKRMEQRREFLEDFKNTITARSLGNTEVVVLDTLYSTQTSALTATVFQCP
jgi:hypothetical protein